MLFRKKNCSEATCILRHVDDLLAGKETSTPTPDYPIHKTMLDKFQHLFRIEKQMGQATKHLLKVATALSAFDVNLSFSSDKLSKFSSELSEVSSSNLAIVEETTANMNQVSETITEVSGTLSKLSESSEKLVTSNNEGLVKLEEIVHLKEDVMNNAALMNKQIEALVEMTHRINDIVKTVDDIAGQTNLLALNASIEAARAGEQGRGFAVVADEIRKLAENTRVSLESMRGFVEGIQKTSQDGIESMNSTIQSTSVMSEQIDKVTDTISSNVAMLTSTMNNISDISESISGIQTSAAEINMAMESSSRDAERLTEMTLSIQEDAIKSAEHAKRIGEIDSELSVVVKESFQALLGSSSYISPNEFIEHIQAAISAHRGWYDNLAGMVNEMQAKPIQTDDRKCAFGHFYHTVTMNIPAAKSQWDSIDSIHHQFHQLGEKTIEAIHSKNESMAKAHLAEAKGLSEKVVQTLESIISTIKA